MFGRGTTNFTLITVNIRHSRCRLFTVQLTREIMQTRANREIQYILHCASLGKGNNNIMNINSKYDNGEQLKSSG